MKTIKILFVLMICVVQHHAQITSAKITFERKTNLFKKFGADGKRWLREEDKIKIDYFELYLNDTCSLFKPQDSDLREQMEWATSKNTVYQNFNTGRKYMIKNLWGDQLHLNDSLIKREWKITESTRKIAGYTCRKARWDVNDTMRVYAWFSYDIVPSTGPESFNGLPGTILGLATEDGGVIYFAKKVELVEPPADLLTPPKKKKTHSVSEIKEEMTKRYGKEKWFKRVIQNEFGIW